MRMTTHNLILLGFAAMLVALLGPLLLPGYVLTLDMVWPTHLIVLWDASAFNNALPLNALLALLGMVLPSWVVQKVMFITLFSLLLYIPYRFLPYIPQISGRIFAALIYTLNPFVYSRMLAGQWQVLFGYALLPLVLHALVRIDRERNTRSAVSLTLALVAVGVVSIHFFYIAIVLSVLWIARLLVAVAGDRQRLGTLMRTTGTALLLTLMLSTYWLVPALLRSEPLEARFSAEHFAAFAASGTGIVPAPLNVLALGGMWIEGMDWRTQFLWPQDEPLFWVAWLLLMIAVAIGMKQLLSSAATRMFGFFLLATAVGAYVCGLGVWGGTFSDMNLWLYTHIPGWTGLRDSQKLAGVLALVYALASGVAVSHLSARFTGHPFVHALTIGATYCVPALFGMYVWWGLHAQLTPVWYPASWYAVREMLATAPKDAKVLALPWHGYFALPFADDRIVANSLPAFFGANRIIASRSVELGKVYDQEVDPAYRMLDRFVRTMHTESPDTVRRTLHELGISYVVVIERSHTSSTWLYTPLNHPEGDAAAVTLPRSITETARATHYADLTLYRL